MAIFHDERNKWFILYFIFSCYLARCCHSAWAKLNYGVTIPEADAVKVGDSFKIKCLSNSKPTWAFTKRGQIFSKVIRTTYVIQKHSVTENDAGIYFCWGTYANESEFEASTNIFVAGSCDAYDVRITGPLEGVVEICINGSWRRICSLNFGPANARVVCRELGYSPINAMHLTVPKSPGPDNRASFSCGGSESKIGLCVPILQQDLCSQHGDAGVICLGICRQGDVRLVGGPSTMEGRVEVCLSGRWGTVCDDFWDDNDARVVCQQMEFYSVETGAAALNSTFSWGSGPIHLSNVQCTGIEEELLSCPLQLDNNCFHSEDAGVTCLGQTLSRRCTYKDLRLIRTGEAPVGLVEVCTVSGNWVRICSNGWTEREAQVACRQLGYSAQGADSFVSVFIFSVGVSIGRSRCSGDEINFNDCNVFFTSTCASTMFVGIQCKAVCLNGEIRLTGGRSNLEGRVEVCVDGRWETISDDGWGVNEATVVCRQLNYNRTGAVAFSNAAFGEGSGPIVFSRIICMGHEALLASCEGSTSSTIFSHSEDAGVRCSCYENSLRLVNGSTSLEGRVEVCINGTYGTICDDGFDIVDASVICRQLQGRALQIYSNASFGAGFGFIVVNDLQCTGNELSLVNCNYDRQTSDCSHGEDASVTCEGSRCLEHDVRLGNDDGSFLEGRVEVCIEQSWWSVCDNLWDNLDAEVVCRQLGYSTVGAVAIRNYYYTGQQGIAPFLDSVACSGSEASLYSCMAHQRPQFCNPLSQAGVRCQAFCVAGKVRLTGGNTTFGRVEVCLQGSYRTVCHDDWDNNDATVVCRQLHQSATGTVRLSYGSVIRQFLLSGFQCSGNESSLLSCARSLSPIQCMSSQEAGALCMEGCTSDNLRRVKINPTFPERFFVEMCVNGVWRTVCRSNWGLMEITVVCRELGYSTTSVDFYNPPGGLNPLGPYVGNFMCSGSEVKLAACAHNLPSNCDHPGGVQCSSDISCIEGQTRLIDSTSATNTGILLYDGRVEICLRGTWGTICDDLWDDRDAQVVCSSLGFSRLGAIAFSGGRFPAGTGSIKLSNTICTGSETSLLNCSTRVDHTCTHAEDAGVRCIAICPPSNFTILLNCKNGGFCALLTEDESSYFCQCLPGFTGQRCEIDMDNYCMNMECQYGTCLEGYGENVECSCRHGFTGEFCESQVDWCHQDICQNSGSCRDHPIRGILCDCMNGFTGYYCETELCPSGMCMNGGTCLLEDGSCNCRMGFTGQRCESIDFCVSQPCMNGGTCEEDSCICPLGYEGGNCGMDVDNCFNTICENGGTCIEGEGISTSCMCTSRYGGTTCGIQIVDENAPCPEERDEEWNLSYTITQPGGIIIHPCSNILPTGSRITASGETSRTCGVGGIWGPVDVSSCRREDIMELERMANEVFGQDNIQGEAVDILVEGLANATTPQGVSQFPTDLEATTSIIDRTVLYLQGDLQSLTQSQLSTRIVKVMSNTLDSENVIGWNGISEGNVGSESLLRSAEIYGNYFATALGKDNINKSVAIVESNGIIEDNIELRATGVNMTNIEDVVFPAEVNSASIGSTKSIVPSSFLVNRGAENHEVNVINILFKNLESILPRHSILASQQPGTSVISTQVISTTGNVGSQDVAVKFQFTTKLYGSDKEVTNATCVFFKFERNLARSTWSTENVTTTGVIPNGNNMFNVSCESQHLTSFSVLVNVNNAVIPDDEVLTYITYIGLSISMFCLILTILFLVVVIRTKLFESVHYFIHLNLSIALLLGYVVFLAGIETAVGNRIGCAFVAGLLHYLFTAAFCWMLCEGIMLYLMLVVVFSELSKKWWLFLLLGWGPPLIIVGVSAAIIHRQYGTEDYCWISAADPRMGAVWAFALPMLVVIIINTGFLIAALVSLYRLRKDRQVKLKLPIEKKVGVIESMELFRHLLLASMVLLPLLGLTWVFGLLSVNESTVVFAYLFTILNSLQGFFIFVFHVIRSEKVWGRFCSKKSKSVTTRSTNEAMHKKVAGRSSKSQDYSSIVSSYQSEAIELDDASTNKPIEKVEPKEEEKDEEFSDTIKLIEDDESRIKTHI